MGICMRGKYASVSVRVINLFSTDNNNTHHSVHSLILLWNGNPVKKVKIAMNWCTRTSCTKECSSKMFICKSELIEDIMLCGVYVLLLHSTRSCFQ